MIATVTLLLSTLLALAAGYLGGWIDAIVSRAMDVLYSLPPLIVAIVLVGVFGGGYWLAIGVLIVLGLPHNVRLLRAAVIERRHLPYIEAAETLGVSRLRVMACQLLPNIAPVVAACFFLRFTYGISTCRRSPSSGSASARIDGLGPDAGREPRRRLPERLGRAGARPRARPHGGQHEPDRRPALRAASASREGAMS